MTITLEREGKMVSSNVWRVLVDGRVVLSGETYTVASQVAEAIEHPERWEPTEAQEIADGILKGRPSKVTSLVSFGFKNGFPKGIVNIVDIRAYNFRNPWALHSLRSFTGLDEVVQAYIRRGKGFQAAYASLRDAISKLEGAVYVGCTGGHHRSVFLVEAIGHELEIPLISHRDLDKD